MMQRRHFENAFAIAQFVAGDLQNDRKRFEHEDATDKGQQQLLLDDNRDRADGATQRKRSDVAHEDFCRVSVVPKKADAGADHGAAEDSHFADQRHALNFQVVREDGMAADIGEHSERAGGDDGAADGEAIESVRKIDGVA